MPRLIAIARFDFAHHSAAVRRRPSTSDAIAARRRALRGSIRTTWRWGSPRGIARIIGIAAYDTPAMTGRHSIGGAAKAPDTAPERTAPATSGPIMPGRAHLRTTGLRVKIMKRPTSLDLEGLWRSCSGGPVQSSLIAAVTPGHR